jgi:choline dehydrogenase-like flavoprotein
MAHLLAFILIGLSCIRFCLARPPTTSIHTELLDEYDFIVVGGGTAGLTVGDRLSEDGKHTVLVVEYGYFDTSYSIRVVQDPIIPDFPPDPDSTPDIFPSATRMYNLTTVPIPGLSNRTFAAAAGAVVGGSSAVNGMFFDRGTAEDYDSWALSTGEKHQAEYAKLWGWENILPMFKKSVTFQTPTPEMVRDFGMTFDVQEAYGGTTPIDSAYPPFVWPAQLKIREALRTVPGMSSPIEGAGGDATGEFWVPNSVDYTIRKRSYSLIGHYLNENGPATRDNFYLLPAHRVTQVLLDQLESVGEDEPLWKAKAVLITPRDGPMPDDGPLRIKARKEIILSAGSVHTPQILQRSGIGPKDILEAAGASVKIELPGVGANLHDHAFFFFRFNCKLRLPFCVLRKRTICDQSS